MKICLKQPTETQQLIVSVIERLAITGCLIFMVAANAVIDARAQNSDKTITFVQTDRPQVKFKDIKFGENTVKLDEKFTAAEDWLKRLSFNLENVSGKSIVFLTLNINFPETRATGPMLSFPINFGQRPGSIHRQPEPLLLKRKQVLEVSLGDYFENLAKFINARQPIGTIKNVELEIFFIVFRDGIAWNAGAFMKQDAENPNRYTLIENHE